MKQTRGRISEGGAGAVLPFVRARPANDVPTADELQLVLDATDGRRTAQHTLYVRHVAQVRTRISRFLGNCAEVDDVLQDTFVSAFRDLRQLADPTRFGSWVCGIAVHQVHRRLRRRRLLQRLGFRRTDDGTLCDAVDPAAGPETRLLLEQLDAALHQLEPRQRVAWVLRYVEGCSLDEVAHSCRTSLATAKRDIARAEQHLNALLWEGGER